MKKQNIAKYVHVTFLHNIYISGVIYYKIAMTTALTTGYSNGRGGGTLEGVLNNLLEAASYMGEPEYAKRFNIAFKEFIRRPEDVGKLEHVVTFTRDIVVDVLHGGSKQLNDNYISGLFKYVLKEFLKNNPGAKELVKGTELEYLLIDPYQEIQNHGYGIIGLHGHGAYRLAYSGFEKEFPNLIGLGYNFFGSIKKAAPKKAKEIYEIIKKTGVDKLVLIGHSQGATMNKQIMVTPVIDEETGKEIYLKKYIKILINVCGTHKGTRIAGFSPAQGAREIYHNSGLMMELSRYNFNGSTVVIDIMAKRDKLVKPLDSAFLLNLSDKKLKNYHRYELDCGHLEALYRTKPIMREAIQKYILN